MKAALIALMLTMAISSSSQNAPVQPPASDINQMAEEIAGDGSSLQSTTKLV